MLIIDLRLAADKLSKGLTASNAESSCFTHVWECVSYRVAGGGEEVRRAAPAGGAANEKKKELRLINMELR